LSYVRKTKVDERFVKAWMTTDLQKLDELLASTTELREDELADHLASLLSGLNYAATGTYRPGSGIFWALTRLFGCYDRVVAACEEYSTSSADGLTFVAALEIEHFLIRLRVLLDEVAYDIRVRLPRTVRGLGQPQGPGASKHFSINDLLKFVNKHATFCQYLSRLLESNRGNIHQYIELRDDIAHFRAQALIFLGDAMSVGFIGSRENATSQHRIPHSDLLTYVNNATMWMWRFLQRDVVAYFRARVENGELGFAHVGIGPRRIGMPGIIRFKQVLGALPPHSGSEPT
jgi:hypothetical protein